MNTVPFTPQQLLHFDLLFCMQEAVFESFFLASKLNVAGSIPVTRFQKPLRMALKAMAQQVTSPRRPRRPYQMAVLQRIKSAA